MIRPPLPSEILARHPTDKTGGTERSAHNYGGFYDDHLSRYRWCDAVLEVGILEGHSLRAWAEFFPDAAVVGLDCARYRLVNDGRIRSYCVDCGDPHQLDLFAREYAGRFSVAIDDGSHRIEHQLLFVRTMKRCLKAGGLIVVEDVAFADYAPQFEAEGCRVVEFDVASRSDDRIAFYIDTGDY